MSISEISRRLGIDRNAIRKYKNSEMMPRPSSRRRKSKLNLVKSHYIVAKHEFQIYHHFYR